MMALQSSFFLMVLLLTFSNPQVIAQQTTPLEKRNVSGIVRDSLNKPIVATTVSLLSDRDTMQTATNDFGYYAFNDVKSADFLLTIKAMGYDIYNRRYFNNDTKPQLMLPPVRLGVRMEVLEEVTIERLKGPLIKGDTTEFWARDYIVRDYARLEDLLRRMEGITIEPDGSVMYNGERVVRALFNNETYFSGSVQDAMKELPADIVDRIQIIDRNVDGTSAKLMASEETVKVMNIVTKADKSAGKMYDVGLHVGTQSRMILEAAQREIDGSDQRRMVVKYVQIPEGLKNKTPPGFLGGGVTTGFQSVSGANSQPYDGRNQMVMVTAGRNFRIGNISLQPHYNFAHHNIQQEIKSLSENFYPDGSLMVTADSDARTRRQDHQLVSGYRIGNMKENTSISGDFSVNYSSQKASSSNISRRRGIMENFEEDERIGHGSDFNYEFSLRYQKKQGPKLVLSSAFKSKYDHISRDEEQRTDVFAAESDSLAPDSSVFQERMTTRFKLINSISNALNWASATDKLKIKVGTDISHSVDLVNIQAFLQESYRSIIQPDWSNYQRSGIFEIPASVAVEYEFGNGFRFSPKMEMRGVWLSGRLNPSTPSISRFDGLPDIGLSLRYRNPAIGMLTLVLRRHSQQPSIDQLNPDPFYWSPFMVVIGDPGLENSRNSAINLHYNHSFNRLGISLFSLTVLDRANRIIVGDRSLHIDPETNTLTTFTRYLSTNGGNRFAQTLEMGKSLFQGASTLSYRGSLRNIENPYYLNGQREWRTTLSQNHRLSLLSQLSEWLDLTPIIHYTSNESTTTLKNSRDPIYNYLLTVNLNTGLYLLRDFKVNFDLSQSLQRTTNLMSNNVPFVANANIEKRLFRKKDGIISFVVMDIARQDAFTNFVSNEMGYINSLSNLDSRYFLLQFSWKPQVWGRSKQDMGQGRRGDGSFVN